MCVHSSGAIYFSDPWYGRFPGFGHPRKRRLGFQGVYRIPAGGGDLELIVDKDEFDMPNGLCFSPDESLLYINDTPRAHIKVWDADADGSISNGRMFFEGVGSGVIEEGIPDGMKCDERGNIWVTGPGGRVGDLPRGRAPRHDPRPREHGEHELGRRGLAHALHPELDLALRHRDDRRPAPGAVHGRCCMNDEGLSLDAARCVLIVQDLQNDVMIDGGAFAETGAPEHAKEQNVVENVKALAETCRSKGIPVIHVWYIVEEGAPGLKLNAPLFDGVKDTDALVRGSWGAAPAEGLEAQDGDFVVEKMRMNAWEGTRLESLLKGFGRDTIIVTGRLDEHVRRAHLAHGRRQGLLHGRARGRLLDDERGLAQRLDQLRAPERLDRHHLRGGDGSARRRPRRRVAAPRRVAVVCGQRPPSEPYWRTLSTFTVPGTDVRR